MVLVKMMTMGMLLVSSIVILAIVLLVCAFQSVIRIDGIRYYLLIFKALGVGFS